MGRDLPVRRDLVIPAAELRETASRARGPGGQHLQKTSTRVTLRWSVVDSAALGDTQRARLLRRLASRITRRGELVVHASATRSRARNRERARARLAELVRGALALRRPRRPTAPRPAARERRLAGKRRRAALKQQRARPRPDED